MTDHDEQGRELDARITDAPRAASAPSSPNAGGPAHPMLRRRWAGPLLAAVAVAAVAVGTTLIADGLKTQKKPPLSSSSPALTQSSAGQTTSSSPPTSSAASTSAAPTASAPAFVLDYEPLWPFATFADAEHWRTSGGGSQPWHADAGETALNFTRGYLGFTEIDRVTSTKTDSNGAHIGVGYLNPTGARQTAAVLHLVRFGSAQDAPWEVVGSDDTDFSIEKPEYGSTVSSPITVSGRITGVDENIHVWVRSLASSAAVGDKCCLPAGDVNSPWSVAVSFTGGGTLTLVASTGGHIQQVERFAIHGVHANR